MSVSKVRVRFAPSPTGLLHIGGARTALFNWLFARHLGGTFVLRIEDTDRERSREEAAQALTEILAWLGLDWDEGPIKGGPYGPYFQSQRLHLYREAVEKLVSSGYAYPCYCTPEELEARREDARQKGIAPRYDGRCGNLSAEQRQAYESEGRKPAIRIKVPNNEQTVVDDVVRGKVVFENEKVMDDFIIMKSDGWPTYNLACVVDDALMEITHVVRAEEHLSNTPKQIVIYRALDYTPPVFAHAPMILAPDRSKLSKRHGAVAVEEFRDAGYLPEAILNYLALLGWSPGEDKEIMNVNEIIQRFSLERINKTAAIYDVKKLEWMNGQYIRAYDLDRLVKLLIPRLQEAGYLPEMVSAGDFQRVKDILAAGRDRVNTLGAMPEMFSYFFVDFDSYDKKGLRKYFNQGSDELLERAREVIAKVEPFTIENVENAYRELAESLGVSAGHLIHPTRLALTGRTIGPGLFDIIFLLGRDKCIERIAKAITYIRKQESVAASN